jgi:hypothetical protein
MSSIGTNLRFAPVLVALIAIFAAGTAEAEDYAATGPYAGLGFAIGFENFDTFGVPLDFDPAYGFDAWAGHRFHPNLAGELQIEYVNGFDIQGIAPAEAKLQGITFTGNLKAYLLTGRWQPFGLVGIGLGWQEAESTFAPTVGFTGFAARFGGGLDFYVNQAFALNINAGYILQTGDLDGADYVSLVIGGQYRF